MDAAAVNAFETAGWERVAPAYERFFGPIRSRVVDRLLDAAGVGVGTRLLDVAAGAGHVCARAAERGAAQPPPESPEGPPFFRFSDDGEFALLLGDAGFSDVGVETVSFAHAVESADALWDGLLGGTVRTAPLVERQDEKTRAGIRAAFERGLEAYAGPDGLELPVSVKLASGTRAR